jgi:predicted nucleic-acid-binding protein
VTGIDTNVLVRYLVKDDPAQAPLAVAVMNALTPAEPGWLGLAALAETVWVLSRTYRLNRDAIIAILAKLLASRDLVLEQRALVQAAFLRFRSGKAQFADCLIAASARAAGCTRTVTFDRVAARDAGMELLT